MNCGSEATRCAGAPRAADQNEAASSWAWVLHRIAPRVVPLIGFRTLEQFEAALPALELALTEEQPHRLDAPARDWRMSPAAKRRPAR